MGISELQRLDKAGGNKMIKLEDYLAEKQPEVYEDLEKKSKRTYKFFMWLEKKLDPAVDTLLRLRRK